MLLLKKVITLDGLGTVIEDLFKCILMLLPDLDPLINNNNIALVLNDSKNNDKDNEDM